MMSAAAGGDIQGMAGGAPNAAMPPATAYGNPTPYMMWNPYSGLAMGPVPPLLQQPNVYGQQPGQQLRFGFESISEL